MGLKFAWLAVAVLVVMVIVAAWRFIAAGRAANRRGAPVARTDRLKALPRYRALVGHQLRWLLIELACVGLTCLGAVAIVARPAWVGIDSSEMRNRDVVLCLDVSGSMSQTDAAVIASYQDLVSRLHGERIGFVVFDSAAATVFPLTDDYAFIADQLDQIRTAISQGQSSPVLQATRVGNRGASLIGDGLTSCVQQFDRLGEQRSRTVVLATDNNLSGNPLFTLAQAVDQACAKQVLVYGVTPSWAAPADRDAMRTQLARTGGQVLTLNTGDPAGNLAISHGIEAGQRRALLSAPSARSFDQPWPGAVLASIGLAGMVLASWRLRS